MSLHVYKRVEDLPKGMKYVKGNDGYFDANTKLNKGDNFHISVLRDIEHGKIVSETTFMGRQLSKVGSLYSQFLSTGTKTLLNVYSHPDICFDSIECGPNAIEYMLLNLNKGNILMELPVVFMFSEKDDCDIIYQNQHFTSLEKFTQYLDQEVK